MTDTDDISKVLIFHEPRMHPAPLDLDQFHEWNVAFALDRLKSKASSDEVVSFFTFHLRSGTTRILETKYRNPTEKYAVFDLIRMLCATMQLGVAMVSHLTEAWVATNINDDAFKAMRAAGLQVRHMPDREDCLMVNTFMRPELVKGSGKDARFTRWVIKPKPDPRKTIVLERDDLDMNEGRMAGEAMYFFEPVRTVDDA